jgi:hypothetical protein
MRPERHSKVTSAVMVEVADSRLLQAGRIHPYWVLPIFTQAKLSLTLRDQPKQASPPLCHLIGSTSLVADSKHWMVPSLEDKRGIRQILMT